MWPPAARADGVRLVVTVYDLIPLIYPEHYLPDPSYHARYKNRVELIRLADRVFAISHATGRDLVSMLDLPRRGRRRDRHRRLRALPAAGPRARSAGCRARPPAGRAPRLLLYAGALDFRKNVDALLIAYSRLPRAAAHPAPARDRLPAHAGRARRTRPPLARPRHRARRGGRARGRRRRPRAALPGRAPVRVPVALRGVRATCCRGNRLRDADHRERRVVAGRNRHRSGRALRSRRSREPASGDGARALRRLAPARRARPAPHLAVGRRADDRGVRAAGSDPRRARRSPRRVHRGAAGRARTPRGSRAGAARPRAVRRARRRARSCGPCGASSIRASPASTRTS